jgi:hypothetical protein
VLQVLLLLLVAVPVDQLIVPVVIARLQPLMLYP